MDANVPMTVICSKASEDIRTLLEGIMKEHNISADLMCMIIRDAASHFERMRANDYNNAIIQLTASVDALKKENEALKATSQLFDNLEGSNDNTADKT